MNDGEVSLTGQATGRADITSTHDFHIPSLDGIRALSFLVVFLSHTGLNNIIPGGFGVTVFFFVSGYLITTLLRMEYDRSHEVNISHFYLRRVLRIFPPFYIVLLGSFVLVEAHVVPGTLHVGATIWQLAHLTNYHSIIYGEQSLVPGTSVYWSLAVEEHFYLIFPIAYFAMRRAGWTARRQARVLAAVCGVVLVWRLYLVFGLHVSTLRTYLATDTRIDSILFGCILAVWRNPILAREERFSDRAMWRWLLPTSVILLVAGFAVRGNDFRETFRYTLQGVALVPLVAASIAYSGHWLFRWLSWRAVAHIGVLSYTLYLSHAVILEILLYKTHLSSLGQHVAAFLLALAVAEIMRLLVERPAARLRRSLTNGRPVNRQATGASP